MITALPPAPSRGDDSDVFVARADAHIAALPRLVNEINAMGEIFNLSSSLATLGYLPPVLYVGGLAMKTATQTVQHNEVTYAPKLTFLPFTTSGEFEVDKFRVIQGVTANDLGHEDGAAIVGFGRSNVAKKLGDLGYSVMDDGASRNSGAIDTVPAATISVNRCGHAHFPADNTLKGETTYFFDFYAFDHFRGASFSADQGVVLSLPTNEYMWFEDLKFTSDITVFFRDINVRTIFPRSPNTYKSESPPRVSAVTRRSQLALDVANPVLVSARSLNWPSGDEFTDVVANRTSSSIKFFPAAIGFVGAFVELGPYETISALFDSAVAGETMGVMVRGIGGISVIYGTGDIASNYFTATKQSGMPVVGNIADLGWVQLGQARYASFHRTKAIWSVTRIDRSRVVVKLNGRALTAPYMKEFGDVMEVGFVKYTGEVFTISGFTIERRTDAVLGMQEVQEIRCFGDSTAANFPGSWTGMLKNALDGLYGLSVRSVSNFAVAGHSIAQQYAVMQEVGLGNSWYTIWCAGTNDVQGQTPLDEFETTFTNVLNYIISGGRRPVILVPWMWYTKLQSGGVGQASANYDLGAPYRMAMQRIATEMGAIVVMLTSELANPDPSYILTDPLRRGLRDNIHQDIGAFQRYAQIAAQAIADDYLSMPDSVEHVAGTSMLRNGSTSPDFRCAIDKAGMASISGYLLTPVSLDGTVVMHLPRYLWPSRQTNFIVLALRADSGILGSCRVSFENGNLSLYGAPAGTAGILFDSANFKAAFG